MKVSKMGHINQGSAYPNPAPKAPATPNPQPNQAGIPAGTLNPGPVGVPIKQ